MKRRRGVFDNGDSQARSPTPEMDGGQTRTNADTAAVCVVAFVCVYSKEVNTSKGVQR